MTEQRAVERIALIHPCTVATAAYQNPRPGRPARLRCDFCWQWVRQQKHGAQLDTRHVFPTRPDSQASRTVTIALESKQTVTEPHPLYQRPPHSERPQLCVCFTPRPRFPTQTLSVFTGWHCLCSLCKFIRAALVCLMPSFKAAKVITFNRIKHLVLF